jgi:hypothetical protein
VLNTPEDTSEAEAERNRLPASRKWKDMEVYQAPRTASHFFGK